MEAKMIEGIRCIYQMGAWETFGRDAVAVVSEGVPGEYIDNPTVKEYQSKGYKLVDANMFGTVNETFEILIFVLSGE